MKPIRDVLRLLAEGVSHRAIHRRCGVSRQAVQDYAFRAEQAHIQWPVPEEVDDFALEELLFPSAAKDARPIHPQPKWDDIHLDMKRKGATLKVLHEEYAREYPGGMKYVRFCQKYKEFTKSLRSYMRGTYPAGEFAFVDFAGPKMTIYPFGANKQKEEVQMFVGVLGASSYVYAEALRSQKTPDWLAGHTRMYEAWGGTPQIVVPDNLKAAVITPHRSMPEINPAYSDHARHYNVSIVPARPYKPRDKSKAEQSVLLVERWIMFRLRKIMFTSLADLNAAIKLLLADLNAREMKRLGRSRVELFESIDRPALHSLPLTPYEYAEYKKVRVAGSYHFLFDKHEYSVPYRLVNEQVEVRATANTVEAYFHGSRVASHIRSHIQDAATTDPSHRDPKHAAHLEWNREEALRQAAQVGPACREFLERVRVQEKHVLHEQRAAKALQSMVREFGPERVETACRRALNSETISTPHVRNLLRNNRESIAVPLKSAAVAVTGHENLRTSKQFNDYMKAGGF